MKSSLMLAGALALLLPTFPVAPAHAQAGGVDARRANTRAAKKQADAKKNAATNAEPLYPGATRQSPEQKGNPKLAKEMEALFKLQEGEGNEDALIAKADAILANPAATPFDKSSAAYLAGAAWQSKEQGTFTNASKYYKRAVDENGLHNNNHYRAMLQLAQMLEADDKHAEALAMVDRFMTETKSQDPAAYNIKAQILLSSGKVGEAAAPLEQLLAANPNDKKLMMNLASVYLQSDQDAKAAALPSPFSARAITPYRSPIFFTPLALAESAEAFAAAYWLLSTCSLATFKYISPSFDIGAPLLQASIALGMLSASKKVRPCSRYIS